MSAIETAQITKIRAYRGRSAGRCDFCFDDLAESSPGKRISENGIVHVTAGG